jgi:hypothetical protein
MAHDDRPPFSSRPSLTGHCGHGWSCCWFDPLANDPGRVKTLRGITVPGILRLVVTLRAKKCKNSSSAQRYNQICSARDIPANLGQRDDWDLETPRSESLGGSSRVAPRDPRRFFAFAPPRPPLCRSFRSAISASNSPALISARIRISVACSICPLLERRRPARRVLCRGSTSHRRNGWPFPVLSSLRRNRRASWHTFLGQEHPRARRDRPYPWRLRRHPRAHQLPEGRWYPGGRPLHR